MGHGKKLRNNSTGKDARASTPKLKNFESAGEVEVNILA